MYLLAYNLIRLLMAQAALVSDSLPRQLSFKHILQLWVAWDYVSDGAGHHDKLGGLFMLVAQKRVRNRPGRVEPRALKRRRNTFPLLTKSRDLARAEIRKNGHPKKLK